jgi:DNA repair exonuclease SbcCD ATPase subunit
MHRLVEPGRLALLLTLAFTLAASGCTIVRYYKVNDLKKSFGGAVSTVDDGCARMNRDAAAKQALYVHLVGHAGDEAMPPYAELKKIVDEMSRLATSLEQQREAVEALRSRFEAIAKGKKRIRSDRPEFEEVSDLVDQIEALEDQIGETVGRYNNQTEAFAALAREYRIAELDVAKLSREMRAYVADIDRRIAAFRGKVGATRTMLDGAAGARLPASDKADKGDLLDELDRRLVEIESLRGQIQQLVERFETETRGQAKVWVGPGLVAHSLMSQLEAKGKAIAAAGTRINEVAGRF